MEINLQAIIGTDKKNPNFTVFRNKKERTIDVYFGTTLFSVVADSPDNPNLKLLIAQLFISGIKKKSLTEHFGYSYNAMKRWSDAMNSGDAETLVNALSGQGAPKKLTVEIKSFASHRFKSIYKTNKYTYSKEIRAEINEIFNIDLSRESLRPLFSELKKKYFSELKKNKSTKKIF